MWLNISFVLFVDLLLDLITLISYRQTLDLNSHRLSSYSSIVNEGIRAILNLFFIFNKKISHAQKAQSTKTTKSIKSTKTYKNHKKPKNYKKHKKRKKHKKHKKLKNYKKHKKQNKHKNHKDANERTSDFPHLTCFLCAKKCYLFCSCLPICILCFFVCVFFLEFFLNFNLSQTVWLCRQTDKAAGC